MVKPSKISLVSKISQTSKPYNVKDTSQEFQNIRESYN